MSDKPPILQESEFVVEEGWLYKLLSTLSIWLNKLFLSTLFLLAVWLLWAAADGSVGCTDSVRLADGPNGSVVDAGEESVCNVFLTQSAKFLGAMAAGSFALSILLGFLGIIVGKRIVEATPTKEEWGAKRPTADQMEDSGDASPGEGDGDPPEDPDQTGPPDTAHPGDEDHK